MTWIVTSVHANRDNKRSYDSPTMEFSSKVCYWREGGKGKEKDIITCKKRQWLDMSEYVLYPPSVK